jgi:hypothetical protein
MEADVHKRKTGDELGSYACDILVDLTLIILPFSPSNLHSMSFTEFSMYD